MAPEVVENKSLMSPYGTEVDIWSVGVTALEMAQAGPPMGDMNPMKALFMIPINDPPTLTNPENW